MENLRDYQKEIASGVDVAMKANRRIVVSCPTGGGKTITALEGIVPMLPKPILWITHRRELKRQVEDHKADVTVHMIQSFRKKREYASVIVDEAHHVCADLYQGLFESFPRAFFVALTATPYRLDGVGLGKCGFSNIVYGPDIFFLTKEGFLAPAKVFIPQLETFGSWKPRDAAYKIKEQDFGKGIVYCRTVAEAMDTREGLEMIGIKAAAIHGEMDHETRHRLEKGFRDGETRVLCNHTIFTEGYDVPEIDMVVLNRATESRGLWRQMTGRGLRPVPDKRLCVILDLANNASIHGSIYDSEVYDLDGTFERAEGRSKEDQEVLDRTMRDYRYNRNQGLKEWTQPPKPVSIRESLLRLKSNSPLRKLLTA